MIKRTILTAIILFVSYTFFVIYAPKWWSASQNQWQNNVIKAQKFIYNPNDSIQNLIIGSSLSSRIKSENLPKTYNLSFVGQSIFDGIKLVVNKPNPPKNIFIEMNFVLRPESIDFTNSINSPILYYPRQYIYSLREDKQPIAVLGKISMKTLDQLKSTFSSSHKNIKKDSNVTESKTNNVLFSKMLALKIKEYSQVPSEKIIQESFEILQFNIRKLESKKVNVIFFEMPVNNKLENLPKSKAIRETFYKYFPPSKYNYISLPKSCRYETTDGIHLNNLEAINYTTYFKSYYKNYFQ
jgi:hypothetical protein